MAGKQADAIASKAHKINPLVESYAEAEIRILVRLEVCVNSNWTQMRLGPLLASVGDACSGDRVGRDGASKRKYGHECGSPLESYRRA